MLSIFHVINTSGNMLNNLFPEYSIKQLGDYVLVRIPDGAHFKPQGCVVEAMYTYMVDNPENTCLYHKFTDPMQIMYIPEAQLPQDDAFKELHSLMKTLSLGN